MKYSLSDCEARDEITHYFQENTYCVQAAPQLVDSVG